ncbi:hypothetical protein HQN90_17735 [Paenibacillus alba]|uniref:hypothetical protein n=1 Tax=Paenibacillus alba TaxID=1197127 RepID=UPI0015674AEB|nr:hypothetical protein [Paenibacillus alba]NQX67966.1 hypothetical protein [Paenibacillus alba]
MKAKPADKFDSALSLRVFAKIAENGQLSQKQASEVIEVLIDFYGAESENQILNCGDDDLIHMYREIKEKILERVY